jgi:MGT family glycosyltransferase
MSTALFLSLPAHGHVNPTLPLVTELVRRGERVIYYASDAFRAKVEGTGAEFRSYGKDYDFDPSHNPGGPIALMDLSIRMTERLLPRLLEACRQEPPDYLILDSMCLWGNLLQQLLKCPAVTSCSTFVMTRELMAHLRRSGGPAPSRWQVLRSLPKLASYIWRARQLDRRYGIHTPNLYEFFVNRQALNLVYTSRDFQPMAELLDESYKFVGPSIAPRQESTDFPFDALGKKPLIYISMGTIFNDLADFYRECFTAFGDQPYQVVLSIGKTVDEKALGTPPANFIVRRYVPQLDILERAALFVTHGGMNSASEALLYHVPMVVIPQMGDQFFVAQRVQEVGAGRYLAASEVTAPRLRALAEQVLADPNAKAQCKRIGTSLREAGGYQRAAEEILAFTRSQVGALA